MRESGVLFLSNKRQVPTLLKVLIFLKIVQKAGKTTLKFKLKFRMKMFLHNR